MDAVTVLDESHALLLQSVDDLPEAEWGIAGVCGEWSVREIVAHLTSYERLLLDVMRSLQGQEPTSYMRIFRDNGEAFNSFAVDSRKYMTAQQILNEYQEAQAKTTSLLALIPPEQRRCTGTLSWLNADCCLADFINMMCEHSAEHHDQIIKFRRQSVGKASRT